MSLKRYLITDQHRPILGQPPVNRFATGTAICNCEGIEDRTRFRLSGAHKLARTGAASAIVEPQRIPPAVPPGGEKFRIGARYFRFN
jgi:hypothetical protein